MKRPNVSNKQLLNEIRQTLGSAVSPWLAETSAGTDLFEAYVATLIVRAAEEDGATITYEDTRGYPAQQLRFRTSPGPIYSSKLYTHIVVEFDPRHELEIHLGIRVAGKSAVPNECDVALIHRRAGIRRRDRRSTPRSPELEIATEAKFYSSTIGLDLAREFIGFARDMSCKQKVVLITNEVLSPFAARLLEAHNDEWRAGVVPGLDGAEAALRHFRDAFMRYKAR